jgi:hypothetical protein
MARPVFAPVLGLVVLATVGLPAVAGAASKTKVVAIGDPAPGGGVFAGPSFTASPSAAGNGWLAFRTQVEGGGTGEAIVARRVLPPESSVEVARLGLRAPGGGTFRQFLGKPTVNAAGDVAFTSLVTAGDNSDDPSLPSPAGIFLFRQNPPAGQDRLIAVALARQSSPSGTLDIGGTLDEEADAGQLDAQHTPALDDFGDVAFLSAVRDGASPGGIFVAPAGGIVAAAVLVGDAFDGGAFSHLGQPALNAFNAVAFHGVVGDLGNPLHEGIFTASTGAVSLAVGTGQVVHVTQPAARDGTLTTFEDPVALNDAGDIAFVAAIDFADSDADPVASALVFHAGMVFPLAYSGRAIASARVTGIELGPEAGSLLAGPSLAPDGTVVVFASLNGGASEAIARATGPMYATLERIVTIGSTNPDATPSGGTYSFLESAPAVDATGGVAFLSHVAGGATSEALFYREAAGVTRAVVDVGDASPGNGGFFAGPPFSTPTFNDKGDVVFRGFVARGPTSIGVFRASGGKVSALARAGDPSPVDAAPFTDFSGDPSENANGDVAFAADVQTIGRGIYRLTSAGIRAIALRGDPAPGPPGATFGSLAPSPSINDAGMVAFRGTVRSPGAGTDTINQEGLFLWDGAGLHLVAVVDEASPAGPAFAQLRDPILAGGTSLAFRASLVPGSAVGSGLFTAGLDGVRSLALEQDDLGGGITLSSFAGNPALDSTGRAAFLATRSRSGRNLGQAILSGTPGAFRLVIARGMTGPAGGVFRNLAAPSMNGAGHVTFRGSFEPDTGGTTGVFLATDSGVAPYVVVGETSPLGGRFASFAARGVLNANDEYAFIGNVSRGDARNGIFIASPTTLAVRKLSVQLSGGRKRDHVRLDLALTPGRLSNGLAPDKEPLVVTLADVGGTLWSVTIPGKQLRTQRHALVLDRKARKKKGLQAVRLAVQKNGVAQVSIATAAIDLTGGKGRRLVPPFTVTLEVGDDSGVRTLPCALRGRAARCRAR